ncbi:MAG: phosphotransferase [Candidatus Woesearchaeota archaeon]
MIEEYIKKLNLFDVYVSRIDCDNKNEVYLLKARDGKFVLKKFVRQIYGGKDPFQLELFAYEHFPRNGIPLPSLRFVDPVARITVKQFVEGRHPSVPEDYKSVICYFKKLHDSAIPTESLFYRAPEDIIEGADAVANARKVRMTREIRSALENCCAALHTERLVFGFGDGNTNNLIIRKDNVAVGIDFDFLSRTTRYLDLAILITHAGADSIVAEGILRSYFGTLNHYHKYQTDMSLLQYNLMMIGIYARELNDPKAPHDKIKRLLPNHLKSCGLNLSEDKAVQQIARWVQCAF